MSRCPVLWVMEVIARDKATATFNSVARSADKTARHVNKVSEGFRRVAKVAAVAAGGAALGGLVSVFKTGVKEQVDFLKGGAARRRALSRGGGNGDC